MPKIAVNGIELYYELYVQGSVATQIIQHYGLIPVGSAQINQGTDPGT